MTLPCLLLLSLAAADPLGPGEHYRALEVGNQTRSYVVHVPPSYDPARPMPLVLAFHGAATNAAIMAATTGLSAKADEAGFISVYPNGTGRVSLMLVWNSGGLGRERSDRPDDVAFVRAMLDDLDRVLNVDPRRVYATGISNGGMMCYRLAAELSDRIAAIAPVSGTLGVEHPRPQRAVPVIHFHGTEDTLVPFDGPEGRAERFVSFCSVEKSIRTWARLNACPAEAQVTELPDKADDGTRVTRTVYGPGNDGVEVVLYTIEGGGHTWPDRPWLIKFLGRTTHDISANDLIWEFFERHPKK